MEKVTTGATVVKAEWSSPAVSPSHSKSPSSRQKWLESSQSTPMMHTFSAEVDEQDLPEVTQRMEDEKNKFQSKLREALTEISQHTPLLPTATPATGESSTMPGVGVDVEEESTPMRQQQSQADLFIPTSISAEQKMSIEHYFLESSIIAEGSDEAGGEAVYKCSKGPDDLPGLKAWTLVNTLHHARLYLYD
jgi:hypothetical protein